MAVPLGWATMSQEERLRTLMKMSWKDGDAMWRSLSQSDKDALVARYRDEGELPLLPPSMRDAINRANIQAEADRISRERFPDASERERLKVYRRILGDSDIKVLVFDPADDGRIAVVRGDLTTAKNVAVQVPGISNKLDNFGGLMDDGERLARVAGSDTAVVTWLGYDTPVGVAEHGFNVRHLLTDAVNLGVEAGTDVMGQAGAHQLNGFVSEIDNYRPDARITVVGHSYGSLVTGLAARDGMPADELVFIGSPGTGVGHVSSFAHDGHTPGVHVGQATTDYVSNGTDALLPGPLTRYGVNPMSDLYGAEDQRYFNHLDVRSSHSSYYVEGSDQLEWIADIVSPNPGGGGGGGSW